MRDLIVVGGGPAGSRAAELFARRGASVLLLDPRAPWEKPCGGGLTAAALRNTPDLAELHTQGQAAHELLVVAPSGASALTPLRSPLLVVSRRRLGQWGLDRATAAGAALRRAAARGVRSVEGVWVVVDSLGAEHRSRWLIGADGAASTLRPLIAPRLRPGRIAARVSYPATGAPPGRAIVRFAPSHPGYAWDFPRPGHHSVGAVAPAGTLSRRGLDRCIAELMEATGSVEPAAHSGATLATWDWLDGRFDDLGTFGYALLGDAGGLVDPVTGEGLDFALRSAQLAADVWQPRTGFGGYPAAVDRAWRPDRRRARTLGRWFDRPPVVERLVRQAQRSPGGRSAAVLAALGDAMNEHRAIAPSLLRALRPRWGAERRARAGRSLG